MTIFAFSAPGRSRFARSVPRALSAIFAGLVLATPAAAFIFPDTYFIHVMENARTGRQVLVEANERVAIEAGSAGPGWYFTGELWTVRDHVSQLIPACRFYSPVSGSHFFTADAAECEYVRRPESGWTYEGLAGFRVRRHDAPGCSPFRIDTLLESRPVYRLYSGPGAPRESSHRYTPNVPERDRLVAAGWKLEGVAFCVDNVESVPMRSFTAAIGYFDEPASLEACGVADRPLQACIWMRNLPTLTRTLHVPTHFPPAYIEPNPAYPAALAAFRDRTGCVPGGSAGSTPGVHVRTAWPGEDYATLATRSFLFGPCGFHISASDRLAGGLVGLSPRFALETAVPASGGLDQRFFPWGDGLEREVALSFALGVRTVNRRSADAQLYGLPVITFRDGTTGKDILVAIEAYGTSPPQDIVIRDVTSGDLIVATAFRADPAFGKRIAGDYLTLCTSSGSCGGASVRDFRFSMDSGDFRRILASAIPFEERLSSDPADYHLTRIEFRNEVFGDGELGLSLENYKVEILAPRIGGR